VVRKLRKAVFLDRDGVINRVKLIQNKPHPPNGLGEFEYLPGVKDAVFDLIENKFVIVVVTNQPDVARKLLLEDTVTKLHNKINEDLGIEHFYVCAHDDADACICRKPKPGLILSASLDLEIDLGKSFLVGDRWKDIAAGQSVGCKNFYIDYDYTEQKPDQPYIAVSSLREAASMILESNEQD
jgi:D-glycero-D-manno-heptose 1,7-bisphosphate phosphatase